MEALKSSQTAERALASDLSLPQRQQQALFISLGLYLLNAPLGTYNTLAMAGIVAESRYVPLQLGVTAVMICFAILASSSLNDHCRSHDGLSRRERWLWRSGFYVIGPPVLFAYWRLRFLRAPL